LGRSLDVHMQLNDYQQRNAVVLNAQNNAEKKFGVFLVDQLEKICSDIKCAGSFNLKPLYYDDKHVGLYGARYLIDFIK